MKRCAVKNDSGTATSRPGNDPLTAMLIVIGARLTTPSWGKAILLRRHFTAPDHWLRLPS
jgi:hypothetical protein